MRALPCCPSGTNSITSALAGAALAFTAEQNGAKLDHSDTLATSRGSVAPARRQSRSEQQQRLGHRGGPRRRRRSAPRRMCGYRQIGWTPLLPASTLGVRSLSPKLERPGPGPPRACCGQGNRRQIRPATLFPNERGPAAVTSTAIRLLARTKRGSQQAALQVRSDSTRARLRRHGRQRSGSGRR